MNAENTYFIIETYFLFVCLQFMQQTASIFHPKKRNARAEKRTAEKKYEVEFNSSRSLSHERFIEISLIWSNVYQQITSHSSHTQVQLPNTKPPHWIPTV